MSKITINNIDTRDAEVISTQLNELVQQESPWSGSILLDKEIKFPLNCNYSNINDTTYIKQE